MNFSQIFGEAKQFYDQLSPQQRQMVVQQFKDRFGNSSDPQLQQQAQALDPNNPDPQQLGQMHSYAQQAAPDALNRVMDHPDMRQALSQQGVTGWGSDEEPVQPTGGYADQGQGQRYSQPGQYGDQGGFRQDQGGYGTQDPGQGYGQPGRYGDQGGFLQDQGGYGTQDPGPGYGQPGQYGDQGGYRQDESDYAGRDAYPQGSDGGREDYPQGEYSDGQRGSELRDRRSQEGGQYGQEDPYRRDQGGY